MTVPGACAIDPAPAPGARNIVLKVRFTRGVLTFFIFGRLCNQCVCVVPRITSRLPAASRTSMVSLLSRCRNRNRRSAPKLNDAMAPSGSSSF